MDAEHFIRKSPAVLVIKIILAEVLSEVIYIALHMLLRTIESSSFTLNANVASILVNILMSLIAIIAFVLIVASWASEGVYIKKDEIVNKQGLLKTKYSSYPYVNMQRIEIRQGFIGKLLNFGTVTVYVPVLGMDISFTDISAPHHFAEHLKSHIVDPSSDRYLIQR